MTLAYIVINYLIWAIRNQTVFENDHKNANKIIGNMRKEKAYALVDVDKDHFGKSANPIWGEFTALL